MQPVQSFKILSAGWFVFVLALPALGGGDRLFDEARGWEQKAFYEKAKGLYEGARKEFLKAGDGKRAEACRQKGFQMGLIQLEFSLDEKAAWKKLDEEFKNISKDEKKKMLASLQGEVVVMDGRKRYFDTFGVNLLFRNPELGEKVPEFAKHRNEFARQYGDIIFRPLDNAYAQKPWNSYIHPQTYVARAEVVLPRKELPKTGVFRLWIPTPIQLDCQRNVKIIAVTPKEYLKRAPELTSDIGDAYFEIPLEKIKADLHVSVEFAFTHYEQYFTIDPNNVGTYDTSTDLYRRYTRPGSNIVMPPALAQKAREIIGSETNPYLQARKLYFYVLDYCKYSFMPHMYLYQMGIPESVYVLEHGYGDCGSQSMFFAALCRSVGIPARALGGMLITPGSPSDHFWAEFYLANYGWVPVDPTIDEAILYAENLTAEQRKQVHEYYFGHLDNRRFIIQTDVDIPTQPRPHEKPAFGCTLQSPAAECDTLDTPAMLLADKYYKITIETSY
jgi:transglutaminase-like putative cysteine protease